MADVGQDVPEHAAVGRGADGLGGSNVLAPAVLHEFGAHLPVQAGPTGQPQDQHHGADAAAEHRREGEDEQDARNSLKHVVEPLQKITDLAAKEAAQRPQHCADNGGQQCSQHTDEDRDLGPLDGLGQDIATHSIGAQGQGLGLDAVAGLVLLGGSLDLGIARCQRVHRRQIHIRALGHLEGTHRFRETWPHKGGRGIGHPHLSLPALGQQPGASSGDQQQEAEHDQTCGRPDTVSSKASPSGAPDTLRALKPLYRRAAAVRGHFSTTRGSTSLNIRSTTRLITIVSTARYTAIAWITG